MSDQGQPQMPGNLDNADQVKPFHVYVGSINITVNSDLSVTKPPNLTEGEALLVVGYAITKIMNPMVEKIFERFGDLDPREEGDA